MRQRELNQALQSVVRTFFRHPARIRLQVGAGVIEQEAEEHLRDNSSAGGAKPSGCNRGQILFAFADVRIDTALFGSTHTLTRSHG